MTSLYGCVEMCVTLVQSRVLGGMARGSGQELFIDCINSRMIIHDVLIQLYDLTCAFFTLLNIISSLACLVNVEPDARRLVLPF